MKCEIDWICLEGGAAADCWVVQSLRGKRKRLRRNISSLQVFVCPLTFYCGEGMFTMATWNKLINNLTNESFNFRFF